MTDTFDVLNPATEDVVKTVHMASSDEVDSAVARAKAAWPAWRDSAPHHKATVLRRFASLVEAHTAELAALEVLEAGHTIGNAEWEVSNVVNVFNYFAEIGRAHV